MTYKASIAGLNLGGGKAVIIGDPKTDKSEELFRSFGRFIEGIGGRYITAEDVGMTAEDMDIINSKTKFVTGISSHKGGSDDPSPVTAYGVYMGMKATAKFKWGSDNLEGKKIVKEVEGLHARVVQHEYDHLIGKLYIDRLVDNNSFGYSEEIEKLFELKEKGILTEEEYDRKKSQLLN